MAIDTEDKRRSVTGITGVFTVSPVADGAIGTQDRPHAGYVYSGLVISIEDLAVGRMQVAFTLRAPSVTFTLRAPSVTFTGR